MFSKGLKAVVISGLVLVSSDSKATADDLGAEQLQAYVTGFDKASSDSHRRMPPAAVAIYQYAKGLLRAQGSAADPNENNIFLDSLASSSSADGVNYSMSPAALTTPSAVPGLVPVSDPRRDLQLSVLTGFSQNTTSVAWCGNNAVIAFDDTGSLIRTISPTSTSRAVSAVNASVSTDSGRHFRMLDHLPAGKLENSVLTGDPAVACSGPSNFYYAAAWTFEDQFGYESAISLSSSTDGGQSFGDPVVAVDDSIDGSGFYRPSIAVDPNDPSNIYIAYNSADLIRPTCFEGFRSGVYLVHSTDKGRTWSPSLIYDTCDENEFIGRPDVTVDSKGKVYVAFSDTLPFDPDPELMVAASTDRGRTFGVITKIATIKSVGEGNTLQGDLQVDQRPRLAVDRRIDEVWAAWEDGRNNVRGFGNSTNKYRYADILFSKSSDGGKTWSAPVAVSPVRRPFSGAGRDQFMPSIAIDRAGTVAICYYDRRNDPNNVQTDHYCSESSNGGSSWQDFRQTPAAFPVSHHADESYGNNFFALTGNDALGTYDGTAVDQSGAHTGFLSSFTVLQSSNADVYATLLQ